MAILAFLAPMNLIVSFKSNMTFGSITPGDSPNGAIFIEHNGANGLSGHYWPVVHTRSITIALAGPPTQPPQLSVALSFR